MSHKKMRNLAIEENGNSLPGHSGLLWRDPSVPLKSPVLSYHALFLPIQEAGQSSEESALPGDPCTAGEVECETW